MDRRRLILSGAAGLASACAPSPQVDLATPLPDDRLLFAQTHLELRPRFAAQHFDCAVGARLTARPLPALTEVFTRLASEVAARAPVEAVEVGDAVCARLAPLEGRVRGASRRAALAAAYGEALARAAPDRAEAIRIRARDVALSERLCGLSDAGASDRGWAAGIDGFARLAASDAGFRELLDRAAVEVAEARRDTRESPACAAERRSLSPLPAAG